MRTGNGGAVANAAAHVPADELFQRVGRGTGVSAVAPFSRRRGD
jgi:hypothetical protein